MNESKEKSGMMYSGQVNEIENCPVFDELVGKNRIGKFTISEHLIKQELAIIMELILSKMYIVRAERLWQNGGSMEYIAYSELFPAIPLDQVTPEYQFRFYRNEDGKIILEKVEEVEY